jgi:chromosome segregation ATPase
MKVEIHEIEERKNQHRNDLMENHTKSFKEMKDYYNQITRESLELIKVLRERLQDIKDTIKKNEEIIENLAKEMMQFQEPLTQAKHEAEVLKKSVATFDKDKMALRNARGCLKDLKTKNENIKNEREGLDKQFKRVEQEKESMYKKFEQAIVQLRSRADYKNEKLEEKLAVFEGELEKKELTFRELAQRCGLA